MSHCNVFIFTVKYFVKKRKLIKNNDNWPKWFANSWMGLIYIYYLDQFRITTSCMAAEMKLVFPCLKLLPATNLHVSCVATLHYNCHSSYSPGLWVFLCVCLVFWSIVVFFVFRVWVKHEPTYFNSQCSSGKCKELHELNGTKHQH